MFSPTNSPLISSSHIELWLVKQNHFPTSIPSPGESVSESETTPYNNNNTYTKLGSTRSWRNRAMLCRRRSLPCLLALAVAVVLLLSHLRVDSMPLSTSGRWIIDSESQARVKLRCVNWAAHMPAVLAEGLDHRPLPEIATRVSRLGFNCVRLTWATQLFTSPAYRNLTVAESLRGLGLANAAARVAENNPGLVDATVIEAYEAVVREVAAAGLMVVLDNHVSKPQWCCSGDDGNGYFGDRYFDSEEWIRGLDAVARRFKSVPQVVAMSLRNELRGPNQSQSSWYEFVTRGARTIREANPDLLVIVSGLNYDSDLSFLASRPLAIHTDKLVYEAHWYAFSEGQRGDWEARSPSRVCLEVARGFDRRAGFATRLGIGGGGGVPLFVSEFGVDQRGANRADNRFLSCFLAFAAERDLDWAMWALQGSYYSRNGIAGFDETYGVLDGSWDHPRNPHFTERFQLIQEMLQDPGSSEAPYQIIYHPLTGKCLQADEDNNVFLSNCRNRSRWLYEGGAAPVRLLGTDLCLGVGSRGSPLKLTTQCEEGTSLWSTSASSSGFQLGGVDALGAPVCLDSTSSDSSTIVMTKDCVCLEAAVCSENPQSQWFAFISSNVE